MSYDSLQGRATWEKDKGLANIYFHGIMQCNRLQIFAQADSGEGILHPRSRTFQRFESFLIISMQPVTWKHCVLEPRRFRPPPWSNSTLLLRQTQGNAKAKLTKSLSEQAAGGRDLEEACLTWSVPPPTPSSAPHHLLLCPGFSPPLTPSCDPFVGEKWSRSLETANYRALTSALLNPKCWGTFQQLTKLCVCEWVCICCFIFIEMWAKQRKCLFYRLHKAALPKGESWLIRKSSKYRLNVFHFKSSKDIFLSWLFLKEGEQIKSNVVC